MKKLLILIAVSTSAIISSEVDLKACIGCHGQSFEKSALGKSKIVAQMSEEEISSSLIGYKNGTYGGPMKGLMKSQVTKYKEEELKNSAKEIKGLSK